VRYFGVIDGVLRMGFHLILRLSLAPEHFVIAIMLLGLPIVTLRPEQITSVVLSPSSNIAEMGCSAG
jgi:hypothetical protein